MTSKTAAREALSTAALHWVTYFGHVHRRLPGKTLAEDHAALIEILRVQSLSDSDAALSLIEEIVEAPVAGDRLSTRYVAFWAWIEAQRPKRGFALSSHRARQVRDCLEIGLRGVA